MFRSVILLPHSTTRFGLKRQDSGLHLLNGLWSVGEQVAFGPDILRDFYRPRADAVVNPLS